MNKKLIALAVAGALAAPLAAQAGETSVSGFADIYYRISDDASPTSESAFSANGEVDFIRTQGAVTVRLDVDVRLGQSSRMAWNDKDKDGVDQPNEYIDTNGANIEQAFAAWGINDMFTVLGGVFNNPIGFEKEDVVDMYQVSHGLIWDILDGQTSLPGNNIAGLAVTGNFGMFSGTVGYLNDIGGVAEENSLAVVLGLMPVDGLNLELGYVSQDAGAGDVVDFNVEYNVSGFTVAAEYLQADKIVDNAYGVMGNYDFGMGGVTARWETMSFEAAGTDDTTATTLAGYYNVADNLSVLLEWRNNDNTAGFGGADAGDGDVVQLEIIGTF